MIHVCDKNTTLEALRDVPMERPENAGGTWRGIEHSVLVEAILDECKCRGWETGAVQLSLARKGADLAGAIEVKIPELEGHPGIDGIDLGIGFLTSNARRRALRVYVGGTVVVCNNGLTSGSIVLAKKHTRNTDIHDEIGEAMERYLAGARRLPVTVAKLRETAITDKVAVDLLNKAQKGELMPASRLWEVLTEYHHPTHPEHGHGTGWALLNAFTMIVKHNPATRQMDQIEGFRRLVTAV